MSSVRLTDQKLKTLKPGPMRELWDTTLTGFGVRVGLTGRATFLFRYRSPTGKRRRVRIGHYDSMSLKAARDEAKQIAAAVARGEDPAQKKPALSTSFSDVADRFLREHGAQLAPKTLKSYRPFIEEAREKWEGMQVGEIEKAHVLELVNAIAFERDAPIAANRCRAVLHKLFAWAEGQDLVEANPVRKVPRPAKEKRRDVVLSDPEIKKLWSVLDDQEEPLRSLVRVLLLLGQRSGETRRMRWADIDLKTATWSIPSSDRKGGRPHMVPLSKQALAIIEGLRQKNGRTPFVFWSSSPRASGPLRWLSHAAARLRDAAGFDFVLHDLRRTCGSGMAALGTDRTTISKILGHVDGSVTAIYDRYDRATERRAALEAWGQHVEALTEAKAKPLRTGANAVYLSRG